MVAVKTTEISPYSKRLHLPRHLQTSLTQTLGDEHPTTIAAPTQIYLYIGTGEKSPPDPK